MKLITAEALKAKLDHGDDFKLVMTLGDWAFQLKHIPGSINGHSADQVKTLLSPKDEIIVYCSNVDCIASVAAYRILKGNGYENVTRFAGGLMEWEALGYPLEGDGVAR